MMRDSSGDRRAAPSVGAIVTVCWCGTDGILAPATTQVGLFFMLTAAEDVSHSTHGHGSDDYGAEELARILGSRSKGAAAQLHLKMGFDGCGQTNGCIGMICASGLVDQCRCVVQRVEQLMTHLAERGDGGPVVLNVLGLSRGGMAAMKLAQMLATFDPDLLELNLCLFDPVPGNLLISGALDHLFGGYFTTARQCIDLAASRNLRRCLAIYPHIPLPSCAFHSPIVPRYPALTEVTELVTLECHQVSNCPANACSLVQDTAGFVDDAPVVLSRVHFSSHTLRPSTGPATHISAADASQCSSRVCSLSSVCHSSWRAVVHSLQNILVSSSQQRGGKMFWQPYSERRRLGSQPGAVAMAMVGQYSSFVGNQVQARWLQMQVVDSRSS